jgi:hypothetical protein
MYTQPIQDLRTEALEAGDALQVALCDLAMFGHVLENAMSDTNADQRRHLADHYGVIRDGSTQDVTACARAARECTRVIDSAQAD